MEKREANTKLAKRANGRRSINSLTSLTNKGVHKSTNGKLVNGKINTSKFKITNITKSSTGADKTVANRRTQDIRPRRRASQTCLIKYRLAGNSVKTEEDQLKLALLASLEHHEDKPKINAIKKNGNKHKCNNSKNNGNESLDKITNNNNNNGSNNFNRNICKSNASKTSDSLNGYAISNGYKDKDSIVEKKTNNFNKKDKVSIISSPKLQISSASSSSSSSASSLSSDEEYLRKYKPETEEFLTFICFRNTALDLANNINTDSNHNEHTIEIYDGIKQRSHDDTSESINLKQNISQPPIQKAKVNSKINSSQGTTVEIQSPNSHRRPTRQSLRLANSLKKISKNNSNSGTTNTACDNSIDYEEDVKRASIALEDMAQEITSFDGCNHETAQYSQNFAVKLTTATASTRSSPPFKNNKHLIKGLMTKEFAGAFADEDTIFESISNHKI